VGIPVNELQCSQIYLAGKTRAVMVGFGRKAFLAEGVDVWGDAHIEDDDMCVALKVDYPAYGGETIVGRKADAFAAVATLELLTCEKSQ